MMTITTWREAEVAQNSNIFGWLGIPADSANIMTINHSHCQQEGGPGGCADIQEVQGAPQIFRKSRGLQRCLDGPEGCRGVQEVQGAAEVFRSSRRLQRYSVGQGGCRGVQEVQGLQRN